MRERIRYSLNTLEEANEYADQKRSEGCKDVTVEPLYHKETPVGWSVFFEKR